MSSSSSSNSNSETLTEEEYKVKLNKLRNRYLNSLELGIEYVEDSIETLADVQENARPGDRVKAASTLMTKITEELDRAESRQQHEDNLKAAKGNNSIPIDAAVRMMKGLADAFGVNTGNMENNMENLRTVTEYSQDNRIAPTPGDESLPFHSPESDRTDANYPDKEAKNNDEKGEYKESYEDTVKRGQDFLDQIKRGKE
jgi:hypothetical protein